MRETGIFNCKKTNEKINKSANPINRKTKTKQQESHQNTWDDITGSTRVIRFCSTCDTHCVIPIK